MSQAGGGGGGPLAKAIVEITGSVEPLKAKLSEAEAATKASAGKMAADAGGGGVGGGGGAASFGAPTAVSGANQYAQAVNNIEKGTAKAATNTKAVATASKEAGDQSKFMSIGVAATAGAVAGLGRAFNELWKGIKGFNDGARALANDLKAIEGQFRSDIVATLDPVSKRREEIEATKRAALDTLETEKQQRGIIGDIVGFFSDEAEEKIKIQKIETEAAQAQQRNIKAAEDSSKKAKEEAEKKAAEDTKKSEEEASKLARNLYIQSLDERGQMEVKFSDEVAELERKRDAAKTDAERASYQGAIDSRTKIFLNDVAKIEEAAQREKETKERNRAEELAAKELAEAKAAAAFEKAQGEAIRGLREEVNALFNTGSMEVGIGRLGDLMETLISKSGGPR